MPLFPILTFLLLLGSFNCSVYEIFTHSPNAAEHHATYDCDGLIQMYPESASGVYTINPSDKKGPMMVFCDMTSDGGGWTVIQRRIDGSENFSRPWSDYQHGFGNESTDFWLGNDNIHRLTSTGNMELSIHVTAADGKTGFAHYDSFSIGDANSLYELRIEGFSGDIGDALLQHNCMKFSAIDVDSDRSPVSCATSYHGGWWYNDCETSNLNGDFGVMNPARIMWKTWRQKQIIKTEMKIRPNPKYIQTDLHACHHEVVWTDCTEIQASIPSAPSGIYTFDPDGKDLFDAYCDMDTDGGGWMVIQRRMDGSVNFTRTFHDYRFGFGNLSDEFYLGNEYIHRVTEHHLQKIRFDLKDFEGKAKFEEYTNFHLADQFDFYRLYVGSYYGTAGDSFSYHSGRRFTTIDSDHDLMNPENCAELYRGGWWYQNCHASNLNGEYNNTENGKGINWKTFRGHHYSLKFSEMKIKPTDEP